MPRFSIAVTVFLAGLAPIIAIAFGLWSFCLKVQQRALASAFVGEIIGILRIIETNKIEERLHEAVAKRRSSRANPKGISSPLPQPAIFMTNTNRLVLSNAPSGKKDHQVYTLLAGVTGSLPGGAGDTEHAGAALVQLQEALAIADEVLRTLKPML